MLNHVRAPPPCPHIPRPGKHGCTLFFLRPAPTGRFLPLFVTELLPFSLLRSFRASTSRFLRSLMISGVSTTCVHRHPAPGE